MREIQNRGRTANDVWGDFKFSVATGKISGLSQRQKYGMNDDVNGSFVDVWTVGGTLTYQTDAQTLTVASASANDDADDGTGVREVRVEYLDADFNTQFADVELDGTNSVTIGDDFLRLQAVYALQVGSGGSAAGDITFSANGSVQGRIESGSNALESTHFTIPAGFTGYIVGANVGAGKGDDVQIVLRSRNAGVANSPFITSDEIELFQSSAYFSLPTYYVIPEKHDISIQARSLQGTNRRLFVTYHLILRANEVYRND
jgi:hypothetical protein